MALPLVNTDSANLACGLSLVWVVAMTAILMFEDRYRHKIPVTVCEVLLFVVVPEVCIVLVTFSGGWTPVLSFVLGLVWTCEFWMTLSLAFLGYLAVGICFTSP